MGWNQEAGRVSAPTCPYCGQEAKFYPKDSRRSATRYGSVWMCEPCRAWVGCHPDTTVALGTLANSTLRMWRRRAHLSLDALWSDGRMTRLEAYDLLAEAMNIPVDRCHIGEFDIELCMRVVSLLKTEDVHG